MKKSDRKTENIIREVLTLVCEEALEQVPGFKWLTHLVDYKHFPESLSVVCVFEKDSDLSSAINTQQDDYLRTLVLEGLDAVGVDVKNAQNRIRFDTEEACERINGGRWNERLA
ncbi:MAG: hypothetical protein ACI9OO_001539 [Bacteroidia bacterium]|jgi:hypothetical protein